jgi:hypothetical protein
MPCIVVAKVPLYRPTNATDSVHPWFIEMYRIDQLCSCVVAVKQEKVAVVAAVSKRGTEKTSVLQVRPC